MKNAVNSMDNLIKVNIEPSLVGNYLEGVTTRVEPKAKAMAIITHSIESNLIEKRSAPFVGDDIVWSAQRCVELGRNDLATFGELHFNVARTAIGNQVINMVRRFPVSVKRNIGLDMMNVESLTKLGFSQSTKLASVVISLAGFRRLLAPVLAFVSLPISLITPVIGITPKGSSTPNVTLFRTIFTRGLGAKVRKGFTAVKTSLYNRPNEAGIILTGTNLTTKPQGTFTATSLFNERPLGGRLTTDNAGLKGLLRNSVAFLRTVFTV